MKLPAPLEAVVFDMDGLLLDSERIAMRLFIETGAAFGLTLDEAMYLKVLGTNDAETARIVEAELGDKLDPAAFLDYWLDQYRETTRNVPVPVKQGVKKLLAALSDNAIPAAVATSTATALAERKLENSGLLSSFATVIGGDQVQNSKPHPEIYLRAVSALAVNQSQALALEDSPNGVRAALSAGLVTVQIPDLFAPDECVRALGHAVVTNLDIIADEVAKLG